MKRKTPGLKRPKITRTSYVSLPKELVSDITQLPLAKTQISHCIKFVGILYRDSIEEHWDATQPTPKPQTYLTKTFDDKYYQWLNVLIDTGIVVRSESYSQMNHLCYQYVVNPKYHSGLVYPVSKRSFNVLCKEKSPEPLLTVGYKDIIKNEDMVDLTYFNWFKKDFEALTIDFDLLREIAINHINNITLDEFIVDWEVLPHSVKLKSANGREIYRNTEKLLASLSEGQCLVKDKGCFKVVVPETFLAEKKATMLLYYTNSIERLRNNCLSVKRNTTNNRLDSNFTNMVSELVDEICRQNNLVQIDLSNSQFALLTNLLVKHLETSDFELFRQLTSKGELYAYIAKEIGLKNVKNGKQLLFEVLFSSHRNNSTFKKKIKELFPSVVGWIDQYKKEHGDAKFSVMLQLTESELFVDRILKRIKKAKMLCFSKHDSMIVRSEDLDQAVQIMQEEFAKDKLLYRLKVTSPEMEYFIHSGDGNVSTEQADQQKELLRTSYSGYFTYMSPTYTLTPAQFHELTDRKFLGTVSITEILGKVQHYDENGFNYFWSDLQSFHSNYNKTQ